MKNELQGHFPILLAVLFLVLLVGILISYSFIENMRVTHFIDIPSILVTVVAGFAFTWTRFSFSEIKNAVLVLFKREKSNYDRFRQDYFWQCVIRNLLVFGALGDSIGVVQILQNLSNPDYIDESLSVSMLTFLYSIVFCLILPIPALLFNRLGSAPDALISMKTKKRSINSLIFGYSLFTFIIVFAILLGGSFLTFIDLPSLLLVYGACIWVILFAYGWTLSAILLALVVYAGFFVILDYDSSFPVPVYIFLLICLMTLVLFLGLSLKSKTGLLRNVSIGELLTTTLSLSSIAGGVIGISLCLANFMHPQEIGPYAALAILSCLYGLLGFIFISFQLEDSEHLKNRQWKDFHISRICWYFFPIINQFIVLAVMLILIFSLNESRSHTISQMIESIPMGIISSIKMVGVWLITFLCFIVMYSLFQYLLLFKTYNQMQQTQEQLIHSEKLASLGQLVAGVAHEINNPINFIKSNIPPLKEYLTGYRNYVNQVRENLTSIPPALQEKLSLLAEEADLDFIDRDSDKLINSLEDGSQRIARIVSDLRLYSRVDKDYYSAVNINELIDSTLNLLENRYKKHVTVHKEYGELPSVICSPGQIGQVFMNLLSNAEQAIEGEGHVWIRTWSEPGKVKAQIKDDGKGIAPENLAKIFDPFFTTKPVGSGTGLGLSISLGIVQQHGGEISVAGQPGEGTAFTISLPIRSIEKEME